MEGTGQQSDEHEWFSALFREHYDAVARYAVRRAGSDAGEDVAAQVFLVVWRRGVSSVPSHALPWLYGVARNVIGNRIRTEVRAKNLVFRLRDVTAGAIHDATSDIDDALALSAAWSRLTADEQEVLALVAFEALSAKDAAIVLGCRGSTFRMRLLRARRRLQDLLAEHAPVPTTLDRIQTPAVPNGGSHAQ